MGEYKKQFIDEITNHLDTKLISYFNRRISGSRSITDYTEEVLNLYFQGKSSKSDLYSLMEKAKDNRKKKRKRWYDRVINDSNILKIDDPKHPLKSTINYARGLTIEACEQQFGTSRLEEIAQNELIRIHAWKDKNNSYFIEFPALNIFTPNQVEKAFQTDMIMNIWEYILESLNGDITSFEKQYPLMFIDKPLFAPSSFQLLMNDASSDLLQDIIIDENGNEVLEVNVKKGQLIPPKSMTSDELMMVNIFINNAYSDPTEFIKTRTLNIELSTVASQMVAYNPGSNVKDKIEKCCERLVQYSYSYYGLDDGKMYFNLFDNIRIKQEGDKATIQCMYGDVLFNAIVQQQLISIIAPHYDKLNNHLSKIICFALKKEQLIFQAEPRTEKYTYTFFQKIVRFKLKDRRKNINLIKESLQDFVDNQIIIKSFKYENDMFSITFLPLNNYEIEDLHYSNKLAEYA